MLGLYLTRVKCLVRNKSNVFWTLLFPIVLATLFNLAFSNFDQAEAFHSIPVGIINENNDESAEEFIDAISNIQITEEEGPLLFEAETLNIDEAKGYLREDKIIGYITFKETIDLTVKNSGIEENILKSFIDSYLQNTSTIRSIMNINPQSYENILEDTYQRTGYLSNELEGENPDTALNFFYVLLAMASLLGSYWGMGAVTDMQANLSLVGARINVSPISKVKLLICNMLAAFTIHFTGILILFSYMFIVLNVDFGNDTLYCILTCFAASALGVSLGAMVSALIDKDANFKSAVLTAITMGGSFLAGLMLVQIKYIVTNVFPPIQYINPAHIITDAFYSLYYYESKERFILNIFLMIGYTALFSIITYFSTRRKKYASI